MNIETDLSTQPTVQKKLLNFKAINATLMQFLQRYFLRSPTLYPSIFIIQKITHLNFLD